jgi:hypothetical protein
MAVRQRLIEKVRIVAFHFYNQEISNPPIIMRSFKHLPSYLAAFLLFISAVCLNAIGEPPSVDLSGNWTCLMDAKGEGEAQAWFKAAPSTQTSVVKLPGTLDENGIGFPNADKTDQHLYKPLVFEGASWYFRTVAVPAVWSGKSVELILERTKVTKVWVNGNYVGTSDLLYAKQVFDVSKFILPGKDNRIAISVNNDPKLVPVAGSHAYSPDTQTNWNGIIGRICLEARNPQHIATMRITSDAANRRFVAEVTLSQPVAASPILTLDMSVTRRDANGHVLTKSSVLSLNKTAAGERIEAYIDMDKSALLWSDDAPNLYELSVSLSDGGRVVDSRTVMAGLRDFKATKDGFTINGRKVFLRGKHDACVFPITAHPPMNEAEWERVFRIAKSYGLNHYRFHTFTPPEAAYEAADRVGIYIQCELPIWWAMDVKDPAQIAFMERLGKHILDDYAGHPSFVMMALGNEITKDRESLKTMVNFFRYYDDRPLYAQGSNNRNWDPSYAEGDDYWASFRTGPYMKDGSTDARLSMAFIDSNGEGGLLNVRHPNTTINFDRALERSPVPFSGYEVGQYQVFPNFSELPKYTGVLKPLNLEMYRDRLTKAGMLDQAQDFFRASGALSVICYRADIEAMLRTQRFAAFNLLDLQDYPGQGTALVGMLDAFMDSKGLIQPAEWRQFCSEAVILLEQEKYCWTSAETYTAGVDLSNFSSRAVDKGVIRWTLEEKGRVRAKGSVAISSGPYSGLCKSAQKIEIPLADVTRRLPACCDLKLVLDGTDIKTSYPVWIYPASDKVEIPSDVIVADRLDDATVAALKNGARVILFPSAKAIEAHSVPMQFISEFWNWQMFTGFAEKNHGAKSPGTMGILLDPKHKAFALFPTEYHTDYQWWPMVTGSRALILDDFKGYKPLVQVVDNIARDHRLGLVSEFKVGKGRILVCGSRLPDIAAQYPEARQFYRSLLSYAASRSFKPKTEVTVEQLRGLGL